jgi:acyl-CoA synthetase (NDP forming)
MKAAAGHTGAMAGNYLMQKKLFIKAGILVTESFMEFSNCIKWNSFYPHVNRCQQIAIVSNAGFESVACADHLEGILVPLNDKLYDELKRVIDADGIGALVSPTNPLDLTPSATDQAYFGSTEVFAKSSVDAIFTCIVPLSEKLLAFEDDKVLELAQSYKQLADKYNKPIGIVVDAGALYDRYRAIFRKANLPVFNSTEEAFLAIGR